MNLKNTPKVNTAELDEKDYLPLLGKVMSTSKSSPEVKWESDNQIYSLIDQLLEKLKDSQFPDAPFVTEQLNDMSKAVETIYALPELVNKAILLIATHYTSELFKLFEGQFYDKSILELNKIKTQIPFVIFNSEEESIEAFNFADERIPLEKEECKLLINGSKKYNIALNRIVQAFIIKTPLKRKELCLIFDNRYRNMENLIGRFVSIRAQYIQKIPSTEKAFTSNEKKYDYIICNKKVKEEFEKRVFLKRDQIIEPQKVDECIILKARAGILGFLDEFKSIETRINSFFNENLAYHRKTINIITGDMVRINGNQEESLQTIKERESIRLKPTENYNKCISEIMQQIEVCFKGMENELGDYFDSSKIVPHRVFDAVFETMFTGVQGGINIGQYCIDRLRTLKYDDCTLVEAYLGLNPKIEYREIKQSEWEKAKMYLKLADIETLPSNLLKLYLDSLGKTHINTGKEYYAAALCQTAKTKVTMLTKSFGLGYELAGEALLELYKNDPIGSGVNLQTLCNALLPEACMLKAEQFDDLNGRNNRIGINSHKLTYYKIAATKEYLPAIGKIVDEIYESWFSKGDRLSDFEKDSFSYRQMSKNGSVICKLCRFLAERKYQTSHYNEILGVVLFVLDEERSNAFKLLDDIDTGIANYCKGYMYENGLGTAKNLSNAITCYEKAVTRNFYKAQDRLNECQKKKEREKKEKESDENFDANKDYTPDQYSEEESDPVFDFLDDAVDVVGDVIDGAGRFVEDTFENIGDAITDFLSWFW